jgi:hypothetical protein
METRVCKQCQITKNLSTDFKKESNCYRNICKVCMNLNICENRKINTEKKKAALQKAKEDFMKDLIEQGREIRTCEICNIEKDLKEGYHIDNGCYRKICKDCFNAKRREKYSSAESYKKKEAARYQEHKEEIQAKAKEAKALKKKEIETIIDEKKSENIIETTRVCKVCNIEKDLITAFKKVGHKWYTRTCYSCAYKINAPPITKEVIEMKEKEKKEKEEDIKTILKKKAMGEKLTDIEKGKWKYYCIKEYKSIKSKTPEYRQKRKERIKKQKEKDPFFRIKLSLRTRIHDLLRNKTQKTNELIGCCGNDLKIWLTTQFSSDMTWENFGKKWHIDHVIPISFFNIMNNPEEKFICFHWTNLRPLCKYENLSKGSKIILSDINKHLNILYKFFSVYPEYQTKYENIWWPRIKLGYGYNFQDENELKQFIQNGKSASNHLPDNDEFTELLENTLKIENDDSEDDDSEDDDSEDDDSEDDDSEDDDSEDDDSEDNDSEDYDSEDSYKN